MLAAADTAPCPVHGEGAAQLPRDPDDLAALLPPDLCTCHRKETQ